MVSEVTEIRNDLYMGFFGSYNTPKTEGLSLAVLYGYDGNGSQVHDECRQTYEKAHKLTKRAPPPR